MPKRPTYPMPPDVAEAREKSGLRPEYDARPHYQRNDYVGWIERAKQGATRRKRIAQMLDELRKGGVYMGMTMRRAASTPSRSCGRVRVRRETH